MRSQFECWLWLHAGCTQSSTTRWGTLNLLCLAKSWQTEHHCCCQPEKYWKLLNQHNSRGSVAGLQLHRPLWECQVRHGDVLSHDHDHLCEEHMQPLPSAMALAEVLSRVKCCEQHGCPIIPALFAEWGHGWELCPWSLLWCCLKARWRPGSYLFAPAYHLCLS